MCIRDSPMTKRDADFGAPHIFLKLFLGRLCAAAPCTPAVAPRSWRWASHWHCALYKFTYLRISNVKWFQRRRTFRWCRGGFVVMDGCVISLLIHVPSSWRVSLVMKSGSGYCCRISSTACQCQSRNEASVCPWWSDEICPFVGSCL